VNQRTRRSEGPGEGPLDQPARTASDPIGGDVYPGSSGSLLPPTGQIYTQENLNPPGRLTERDKQRESS
jgi:hypothetical protein